ncbi:MAG: hypothetical protein HYZ72_03495, partial [Deltaproteobacteria bacterium]|nr:hypothetical protein [Deltaproteobacteria bacterium]
LPLLLLFAVAVTGLGLTVSARWLHGHGFAFIALSHAAAVIAMLLYLPFGKFFHIFQRPAQLGVAFYKQAAQAGPQARCGRCGEPFASQMQVADLKQVLDGLGMDYRLDGPVAHYQDICPPCRRRLLALNQARTLQRESGRVGEWESGRVGRGQKRSQHLSYSPLHPFTLSDS